METIDFEFQCRSSQGSELMHRLVLLTSTAYTTSRQTLSTVNKPLDRDLIRITDSRSLPPPRIVSSHEQIAAKLNFFFHPSKFIVYLTLINSI